ncbi:MAG: mechanosensitive ion channel [Phycisphaerae bacterium]|jgi:small conductance mechanosensitive channel
MQQIMDSLPKPVLDFINLYGPVALKAVATLVLGWIAARIIRGIVRRVLHRAKVEPTLTGFVVNMTYALLLALVVVSAIQKLGVPTASFVAVIGAAGLAIGFALQGSLANFAAGVMVILFKPFKVGDYVEAGGIAGTVQEVQVFATVLRTPDNKRVIAPNSAITGGTITNYSANDTRRVDLVFGIGYGDDIAKAKALIEQILSEESRILEDPAPTVAVLELADSSVNFAVRPWVKTPDYWNVLFYLTETIKLRFDAEGISIPFPQRDVHIFQAA